MRSRKITSVQNQSSHFLVHIHCISFLGPAAAVPVLRQPAQVNEVKNYQLPPQHKPAMQLLCGSNTLNQININTTNICLLTEIIVSVCVIFTLNQKCFIFQDVCESLRISCKMSNMLLLFFFFSHLRLLAAVVFVSASAATAVADTSYCTS